MWATHANISPLLLGWGIAALARIATGSATVATITATGLVAQIVERDPTVSRELMVLATGSGSLILSHVNDAGFWLVKEYFGLTVVETFKSWTATVATITAAGRANREAPFNGACPYNPSACFTYLGAGLPKARIVS